MLISADYIDEVILEAEDGDPPVKEEWEGGITFTVHPSREYIHWVTNTDTK